VTHAARWDARIARARELAARQPVAKPILTFYAALAEFQKNLLISRGPDDVLESAESSTDRIIEAIPRFLEFLSRSAPAQLAAAAEMMRDDVATTEWRELIDRYGAGHESTDASPEMAFVVEALLQPFAEATALALKDSNRDDEPRDGATSNRIAECPLCSGKPVVGLLREEGQSARRSLICATCFTEWPWPRIVCPACGHDVFESLPVYQSEAFPAVRVEACDACKTYIKTIDLSKDPLAIAIVDELASVPLDLWAREQGYTKVKANILRM
jgi:formate dehydrogenase accessory protein FdhE